jgi:hypothetical protein
MLVALAITASLLSATLAAFDASWRAYKQTTESASTHVVSRIVVTRLLTMIRTGSDFGPYPADVLDADQNPLTSTSIEFIAEADRLAGNDHVTRIERRDSTTAGQFELWYVLLDASTNPATVLEERPLIPGVREALFILEYEPGPRLRRATIDLTVQPQDDQDMRTGIGGDTPSIRLVASAEPRQTK